MRWSGCFYRQSYRSLARKTTFPAVLEALVSSLRGVDGSVAVEKLPESAGILRIILDFCREMDGFLCESRRIMPDMPGFKARLEVIRWPFRACTCLFSAESQQFWKKGLFFFFFYFLGC